MSTDCWDTLKVYKHGVKEYWTELNYSIRQESSYMTFHDGLSKVREHKGTVFDFTLVCNDDKEIKVHSQVLASQWPFFDRMLSSNMAEQESKTLKFPHDLEVVEAMVDHLYEKQEWSFSFEVAAGLLVAAQMYDSPELLIEAMMQIKNAELTCDNALLAWKMANKAHNSAVKSHCAKFLHSNIGGLDVAEVPGGL
ncbi:hypothetical protein CJU89_2443 [Yarrowia sp. B02]|nr:hypothetical protein CJU89_2443 [Yarrowia sp. B02]